MALEEDEDFSTLRVTRTINTFVPVGPLFRRSEETHTLTLHRPEEVASAPAQTGFVAQRLDAYGKVRPMPGWYAFAATKTS